MGFISLFGSYRLFPLTGRNAGIIAPNSGVIGNADEPRVVKLRRPAYFRDSEAGMMLDFFEDIDGKSWVLHGISLNNGLSRFRVLYRDFKGRIWFYFDWYF